MAKNEILQAFNRWWKSKGQHTPMGNTNYEVYRAGWQAAELEWHRRWHRDTGIPCDGSYPFCPKAKRQAVSR